MSVGDIKSEKKIILSSAIRSVLICYILFNLNYIYHFKCIQ